METPEPILLNIHNIITISKMGTGSRVITTDGTIFVQENPDQIKIKIHG